MSKFSEFPEFPEFLVKLASKGLRIFFIGGILVFSVTDSLVFAKYLGVSAKLAAWRNPPYPTLILWADNVYPDHLCRMHHTCVAGCLSREIRNTPKNRLGDVEILRISRISRISRKIGHGRAPDILSREDFGFFCYGLPYL